MRLLPQKSVRQYDLRLRTYDRGLAAKADVLEGGLLGAVFGSSSRHSGQGGTNQITTNQTVECLRSISLFSLCWM